MRLLNFDKFKELRQKPATTSRLPTSTRPTEYTDTQNVNKNINNTNNNLQKQLLQQQQYTSDDCVQSLKPEDLHKLSPFFQNTNTIHLTGTMLKQCQVIGQVDKKFILVKLKVPNAITSVTSSACEHHHHHHNQGICINNQEENMTNFSGQKALVILDQHATDERINVEKMYKELIELTVLHQSFGDLNSENEEKKMKLDEPLTIKLGIEETEQMVRFESTLNCWGIQFQFDSTKPTDSNYGDDGGVGAGCFNSDAYDGGDQEVCDIDKVLNVDQLISITHLPPLISNRIKRDSVLLRNGIREFLDELSTKKKQEYFIPQYQSPSQQEAQDQDKHTQFQSQSQSQSPITTTSTTTATTQSYSSTTTSTSTSIYQTCLNYTKR
ncbi:unnamed protein product [Ambrosiozyma monospora]|uniref:Unnamed protein product n=1 Tax=Ambrosiozyma monospora TaxID=43982 RepID=A0A9W6SXT5_AMBMO|nr:unnamed protein product [Ambrosiozyma monospora]